MRHSSPRGKDAGSEVCKGCDGGTEKVQTVKESNPVVFKTKCADVIVNDFRATNGLATPKRQRQPSCQIPLPTHSQKSSEQFASCPAYRLGSIPTNKNATRPSPPLLSPRVRTFASVSPDFSRHPCHQRDFPRIGVKRLGLQLEDART